MSDVQDYFEDSRLAAKQSNYGALDADPEQAARAVDLSSSTGVPSTAIYGDLDGFERAHKAALGSAIISDNEYIADYLNSHPMAPRISHDDLGALDDHSRALVAMGGESRLQKWLKSDSVSKSFSEGFGQEPFGQTMFKRPSDLEWAISHPELASVAGAAAMPIEFLARATGGLLHMGYDGMSQMFGEKFAREMTAMAEWGMMRGDLGVKAMGGPAAMIEGNADLLRKMRSGLETSDIYTAAEREPPVGIHPLLDDAKKLQTKEDLDGLDEALRTAQKSATRDRAPDFFANFVRGHVGDREIGISADAIRQLYGDKPPTVDDNLLGWIPDLDKKLAAAEGVGGDIQVPVADWLARVDPEVAKELHDDIRVRDGGLTVNDTKIGSEIDKPSAQVIAHPDQLRQIPWGENDPTQLPIGEAKPRTEPIKWEVKHEDGMYNIYADGGLENAFNTAQEAQNFIDLHEGRTTGMRPLGTKIANENLGAETKQFHPRPEPKETISEPLPATRGSAGLEPMFSVGDRKITLQRMQPYHEGKTIGQVIGDALGHDTANLHDFDLLDETGKKIGALNLSEQAGGKQLYVEMIQAGATAKMYDPNFLGPAAVRDLGRQIHAESP